MTDKQKVHFEDARVIAMDALMRQRNRDEELARRIKTGWASVDADLFLEPGTTVVVAGDTGVGKSSVMMCMANNMAMQQKRILHFVLEDGEREVGRRALGLLGGVPPRLSEKFDVAPSVLDAAEIRLEGLPDLKWLVCVGVKSLRTILEVTKEAVAKGGVDVLIIDYLQEVDGPKRENHRLSITAACDAIQEATRELDCLILLGSQIVRPENRSETFEPNKHHLKESGAIGERADKVLMLWRESWEPGAPTFMKCSKDKGGSAQGKKWTLHYDANTGGLFDG